MAEAGMSDTFWTRWVTKDNKGYGIFPVPERKRVALVKIEGVVNTPIAYFKSVEEAEAFTSWLDSVGNFAREGQYRTGRNTPWRAPKIGR